MQNCARKVTLISKRNTDIEMRCSNTILRQIRFHRKFKPLLKPLDSSCWIVATIDFVEEYPNSIGYLTHLCYIVRYSGVPMSFQKIRKPLFNIVCSLMNSCQYKI